MSKNKKNAAPVAAPAPNENPADEIARLQAECDRRALECERLTREIETLRARNGVPAPFPSADVDGRESRAETAIPSDAVILNADEAKDVAGWLRAYVAENVLDDAGEMMGAEELSSVSKLIARLEW